MTTQTSPNPLRFSRDIQGNILAGFRQDHQAFVLLQFRDRDAGRSWLTNLPPESPLAVATTNDVASHNEEFSRQKQENRGKDLDLETIGKEWINVAFTFDGLVLLANEGMEGKLKLFYAFRQGPGRRASHLGDDDDSAPAKSVEVEAGEDPPANWIAGQGSERIHALVTIAADLPPRLEAKLSALLTTVDGEKVKMVGEPQLGYRFADRKEHFGYRDGISQPLVMGFDTPQDGLPMVPAGQFVLGLHPLDGRDIGADGNGAFYLGELTWMKNGSFQVFRRLVQDVAGWRKRTQQWHSALGSPREPSEKLLKARLIGRWPGVNGTPLRFRPDDAAPAADPLNINVFDYRGDPDGRVTPLNAHIRRMYPRDPRLDDVRHRIIRRGIPFGKPYDEAPDDDQRGLLFNAFMASIEGQFEYLQRSLANNPHSPGSTLGNGARNVVDGVDPVTGRNPDPSAEAGWEGRPAREKELLPPNFHRFVKTTGAVYAFAPSLTALSDLVKGKI